MKPIIDPQMTVLQAAGVAVPGPIPRRHPKRTLFIGAVSAIGPVEATSAPAPTIPVASSALPPAGIARGPDEVRVASSAKPAHGGHDAHHKPSHHETEEAEKAEVPHDPPVRSPIVKLMRQMSSLQDAIALGSTTALAAQRVIARRVVSALAQTPPHAYKLRENADALLAYSLTGGHPPSIRQAVENGYFVAPYGELLAAALAYVEGRQPDSLRHFRNVDLSKLSDVTAGPVHLAMAALLVGDDPRAAMKHLDQARVAAPGTLVEEAALRRAVLIAAELNETQSFEALAHRYLRKFRNSVYAGNFKKRLAAALTRMEFLTVPEGFSELEEILRPITAEARREIYLDLARSAVESGRSTVAAEAAKRSRDGLLPGSLDEKRAVLYAAAAEVVDPLRSDDAREILKALDPTPLPDADQALRSAALRLGEAVTSLPPQQSEEQPAPDDTTIVPAHSADHNAPAKGAPPDEPLPIEAHVTKILSDVDELLRSKR